VPPQSAATGNRCKLQQDPTSRGDTKEIPMLIRLLAGAVISLSCASCATAQLAVVAVDNKVMMDNGTVKVVPNAPPDNVTVVDLASSPPKIIGEVAAPTSVVGPPLSVAVAPDQSIALVTGAMKIDAAKNQQVPDNKLSVIDLQASPPRVLATLEAGLGATGVSINKAGTLALVANRNEGTVSIFTLEGCVYKEDGQLVTGSFMDYALPRADNFCHFNVETAKGTPCTHNPLGVKGCGEAGAIGAPAALINAITDALGVKDIPMPATPQTVWRTLKNKKAA
jgi:hypothetical protein